VKAGKINLPIVSKFDPRGINDATKGMGKLNKVAGGVGLAVGAAFAAVAAAGVAFVVASAKQLMEIEKLNAQTNAAILSTGSAAGKTVADINKLNSSLEKLTGIEAEVIQQGQNMLLTFTKINGKQFDQATVAALDLSVALGKDMQSAAMLVGKALNDPIGGISALSRAGIQFTQDQKNTIAAMVEMNDTAGAQSIILEELNRQFGGSAEAFGETTAGKLAKIEHLFGELGETIAGSFMPVLGDALPLIEDVVESFLVSPEFNEFVNDAAESFEGLLEFLPGALDGLTKLGQDALPVLNELIPAFTGVLKLATDGMENFGDKSKSAFQNLEDFAFLIRLVVEFGEGLNKWLDDSTKSLGFWGDVLKGVMDAVLGALFPVENMFRRIVEAVRFLTGNVTAADYGFVSSGYANPAFANIPRMAEGGIVMPSPGGSIVNVAEAGQPEAIIPLSRLGGMGGGQTVNVTVNTVAGDPVAIERVVLDAISRASRRGTTRLAV
jgi:hypothetical protein